MSGPDGPSAAMGLCALCAAVALGIPAAVYLGPAAPGPPSTSAGALSSAILIGALAAVAAVVRTRRAKPAVWATGLFVLSAGYAVFQVPALPIADAAAGACCLFFIIGLHMPGRHGGDRAGARSRALDEFRPALAGGLVATPGPIIESMIPTQPSVLVGIAAGLLVAAVMVGLARRMV